MVPGHIATYYEPFVGGGALFFALAGRRQFRRAAIADANAELVDTYLAIRDEVDAVIAELIVHAGLHDKSHYYEVRERDDRSRTRAVRAARLIYLNRTGFNGLYRVNSRGKFNVPFGRHTNPLILNEGRLRAVSAVLGGIEIVSGSFERVVENATPGDFVYFDPPYAPLSTSSSFTAYSQGGFGDADQVKLAHVMRDLGRRKVAALLSNSDCPRTRELYQGLDVLTVPATRRINSVATRRGPVNELLVRSFDYQMSPCEP